MLKIEVIKFEAQDVITASVAAPEVIPCPCETLGGCTVDELGNHWIVVNGEKGACGHEVHTCAK